MVLFSILRAKLQRNFDMCKDLRKKVERMRVKRVREHAQVTPLKAKGGDYMRDNIPRKAD